MADIAHERATRFTSWLDAEKDKLVDGHVRARGYDHMRTHDVHAGLRVRGAWDVLRQDGDRVPLSCTLNDNEGCLLHVSISACVAVVQRRWADGSGLALVSLHDRMECSSRELSQVEAYYKL